MIRILIILVAGSLLIGACNSAKKDIDVSHIPLKVSIQRLEQILFRLKTKEEIRDFLQKNKLFAENYFQNPQATQDSALINELYKRISESSLQQFNQEIQKKYADVSDLENQFAEAFKHIKYYYPKFIPPQVCTIVTGFMPNVRGNYGGKDLFVSDKLIVVGIDFFMGKEASFVPQMEEYMLQNLKRENIVPTCMLGLSNQFNTTNPTDQTLLAEMLAYGKALAFVSQIMPQIPDSLIIGYTAKQVQGIEENTPVVWSHYVKEKLFYNTNHFVKAKYTQARPFTAEIGNNCPPRTGWWLGWKIAEKYIDKEHSLPELMQNTDAQQIFTESGYKGK
ncbi:MAG: gliding motility lipoprotein GldB [Verrucomicrobia bacterium]|nr:gliding motility lipoprotein GldB [Cytophagales bacterium]